MWLYVSTEPYQGNFYYRMIPQILTNAQIRSHIKTKRMDQEVICEGSRLARLSVANEYVVDGFEDQHRGDTSPKL